MRASLDSAHRTSYIGEGKPFFKIIEETIWNVNTFIILRRPVKHVHVKTLNILLHFRKFEYASSSKPNAIDRSNHIQNGHWFNGNDVKQIKHFGLQDNLHVHTGALESTHYKTTNVMITDVCHRNHAWLLPFVKCTSIFHTPFVH